jgi:hemoglobin-like flavoprotein
VVSADEAPPVLFQSWPTEIQQQALFIVIARSVATRQSPATWTRPERLPRRFAPRNDKGPVFRCTSIANPMPRSVNALLKHGTSPWPTVALALLRVENAGKMNALAGRTMPRARHAGTRINAGLDTQGGPFLARAQSANSQIEIDMSPESQALVRDSFAKVVPIAPQAASMFYDRLFALDPALKPLFSGDMNEQGRKLMAMIGTAIANLGTLETIVPAIQDLGRRHATYNVQPEHYDTVAAALLWTLRQGLGDGFTPPVQAAWTEAYTTLAAVMKDAAGRP